MIVRGATPDFSLPLDGYDLTNKRVYVTLKQRGKTITKTNEEVVITIDSSGQTINSTIEFSLTQQETLGLVVGEAEIQIKIIDSTGHVDPTDCMPVTVGKALLERVITYDPSSTS